MFHKWRATYSLKALFNNVSALKNLSCMVLHAIGVFDKNEALKKIALQSIMKCFKEVKKDKWLDLPYYFPP